MDNEETNQVADGAQPVEQTQPAAPAAEPNSAGSEGTPALQNDDGAAALKRILDYDPFEPTEQETPGQENQGSVEPTPVETPQPTEAEPGNASGSPAQPEANTASQAEEGDALAALKEELQQTKTMLEVMRQQQSQPQQSQPQRSEEEQQKEYEQKLAQRYTFQVPPQLLENLQSDDPATAMQGVQALLQGTAMSVHKQVMQDVQQSMVNYVPQMIQQTQQQTASREQIQQDFYGTHAEFDKPELRPIVHQAAILLAQEKASQGIQAQWTPQFRDEVAQKVRAMVGAWGGHQPPAQQQPVQAPAPAPASTPFMANQGTPRAPQNKTDDPNSPDAMASLLL